MEEKTNLKYITKKRIKHKSGVEYFYYYVRLKQKHFYCSRKLKNAEDYLLRYAENNNIKNIYK